MNSNCNNLDIWNLIKRELNQIYDKGMGCLPNIRI